MAIPYKTILQSALLTVLTLLGGMLAGGVVGNLIFDRLSGHIILNPGSLHVALGILPVVAGLLIGGAASGWTMGAIAQAQDRWRMVFAGILGFVPVNIILAVVLLNLESVVGEATGLQLPTHRAFPLSQELKMNTKQENRTATAVFGWAILRSRLLSSWVGRFVVAWRLMWLLGHFIRAGAPGILFIMPTVIGIERLRRG